jgi:hypothetical protein
MQIKDALTRILFIRFINAKMGKMRIQTSTVLKNAVLIVTVSGQFTRLNKEKYHELIADLNPFRPSQ